MSRGWWVEAGSIAPVWVYTQILHVHLNSNPGEREHVEIYLSLGSSFPRWKNSLALDLTCVICQLWKWNTVFLIIIKISIFYYSSSVSYSVLATWVLILSIHYISSWLHDGQSVYALEIHALEDTRCYSQWSVTESRGSTGFMACNV